MGCAVGEEREERDADDPPSTEGWVEGYASCGCVAAHRRGFSFLHRWQRLRRDGADQGVQPHGNLDTLMVGLRVNRILVLDTLDTLIWASARPWPASRIQGVQGVQRIQELRPEP